MSRLESEFQMQFIEALRSVLPYCEVIKVESGMIQGFPDRIILYKQHWLALEFKKSTRAHRQPNQEHYIHKFNQWSFARFVSPENAEEVLHEIQRTFGPGRSPRISVRL